MACVDLPGAYLHTENNKEVYTKLEGRLAELMANTVPNIYRKYITIDPKGKPVLYAKLFKALYGQLRAALLFYQNLEISEGLKSFWV